MQKVVLKFGGTSVGNAEAMVQVADIIHQNKAELKVVVASAMSGITDKLVLAGKLAEANDSNYLDVLQQIRQLHEYTVSKTIAPQSLSSVMSHVVSQLNEIDTIVEGICNIGEFSKRTQDKLMSFGETISSYILYEIVKSKNMPVQWLDSRELIVTDNTFGNAKVNFNTTNPLIQQKILNQKGVIILGGFIAKSEQQNITTLGRGGSDYTAAIIAGALQADLLKIWTDVSGMMTADPRYVSTSTVIDNISYGEAMELSHFGAKVIYPPTIQPVLSKKIPIVIKNTFKPNDKGTIISNEVNTQNKGVTGISAMNDMALITLQGSGMVGIPGFSKRLFGVLAQNRINVIFITQASSEHSITTGIAQSDVMTALQCIQQEFEYEIQSDKIEKPTHESDLSIIAIVGDNMRNHHNLSGTFFSVLGKNGINIRAIAQGSSEKNISAVILKKDVKKALQVTHQAFFETPLKPIHLYIAGMGNVGKKLLEQIEQQKKYLADKLHIELKPILIANSKQYVVNENGIDLQNVDTAFKASALPNTKSIYEIAIEKNLENSVFIDNTANEAIAETYPYFLKNGISVVTCNKIACADEFEKYENLKHLAQKYNTSFLFETNVGAGLPIISTLNDVIHSGDEVKEIKAVLSGTLNFIFNTYNTNETFVHVVEQARQLGLTEPDPRIDLSGIDVMRKILILARESGNKLELGNVKCESFLPENALKASNIDDFINILKENESHFSALYTRAKNENKVLRFVATYHAVEGAKVGLESVSEDHPFFNLKGKDNIVLFYTRRYHQEPLVIKGAGAGADVTASGVFADIIKTV